MIRSMGFCLLALLLAGCRSIYGLDSPEMSLRYSRLTGLVDYRNSKDVDAKAKYDPQTKAFEVEVKSSASTVREANAQQMDRVERIQRQIGDNVARGIREGFAGANRLAGTIAPGGIEGLGRGRMDPYWYVALGCAFVLVAPFVVRRVWQGGK